MVASKRMFTDAMPGRIEGGLEKAGVAVLHGETRFTGRDTVAVNGETFSARHFHIATGARPMTLNIPGEELLTTSTDFLELPERPDRAVFVGGGFIAMEFAHIPKHACPAAVTVLEMMEQPHGNCDPEPADVTCASHD